MMEKIKGAGGSTGGIGSFFMGLSMACLGFYLLLNKIILTSSFGMGSSIFRYNNVANTSFNISITSGMIFIPLSIGITMLFYNSKNIWGWVLSGVSILLLIFGVVSSVKLTMQSMSAMDATFMFGLAFGGVGILLRSLKNFDEPAKEAK